LISVFRPMLDNGVHWGNLLQGSATGGYAFTGRDWDAETGLYYYRSRYYDPTLGRFISEDTIGTDAGPNVYAYVDNNPILLTDPNGTAPQERTCRALCKILATRNPSLFGRIGGFYVPVLPGTAAIAPEQLGGKEAVRPFNKRN